MTPPQDQQTDILQPIPTISLKAPIDTNAIFSQMPERSVEKRSTFVFYGGVMFTFVIIALSIYIFILSR